MDTRLNSFLCEVEAVGWQRVVVLFLQWKAVLLKRKAFERMLMKFSLLLRHVSNCITVYPFLLCRNAGTYFQDLFVFLLLLLYVYRYLSILSVIKSKKKNLIIFLFDPQNFIKANSINGLCEYYQADQ